MRTNQQPRYGGVVPVAAIVQVAAVVPVSSLVPVAAIVRLVPAWTHGHNRGTIMIAYAAWTTGADRAGQLNRGLLFCPKFQRTQITGLTYSRGPSCWHGGFARRSYPQPLTRRTPKYCSILHVPGIRYPAGRGRDKRFSPPCIGTPHYLLRAVLCTR